MMLQRSPNYLPSRAEIYRHASETPLEFDAYELPNGQALALKHELHEAGSFKQLGMVAALLASDAERIVLTSAGGAGVAGAYAANRLGKHIDIFAPESIAPGKARLIRTLGGQAATLTTVEGGFFDAVEAAKEHAAENNLPIQSPFNHAAVIFGHGLPAGEVVGATNQHRHHFVPVGGGSKLAGTLEETAATGDRVTGVQFATNTSAEQSVRAGRIVVPETLNTLAEGSAAAVDTLTFRSLMKHRDRLDFVTVTEEELGETIADEYERRHELEAIYAGRVKPDYPVPETTGFVAEAGAKKYATSHAADSSLWVAYRSGFNRDDAREHALLDAYRIAQSGEQVRTKSHVWNGAHTNFR